MFNIEVVKSACLVFGRVHVKWILVLVEKGRGRLAIVFVQTFLDALIVGALIRLLTVFYYHNDNKKIGKL